MERRAVSEVAGTMILIGVVVAGMIIVNLVIIGTPTNTRIPSLQASMTNRSTLITIVHQGGDSIPHGQYKILVDGVDQTGNFMNSGSFPWSIGQTLSYNATTMPHNAIMIYNGTGRGEIVILETKFPWGVYVSGSQGGSGGGGGTTTTLTPTPTLPVLPWYDCSWGYRKNITINRTKVSGTQSDFPVLINLASDTNLSAHALSNGDDIFFTDSDGNKIPHEIESYTSGSGALVAWVKVPSVSSAENTSIFMYYGNSGAPSQQNPTSVWDGNFKGVWHLNNSFSDSTFSHNDGTNQGTTNIAAKIANGRAFDGSSQYITTSSTDLEAATDFTITAWFNPASTSSARHLIWEGNSSANGWGEAIGQLSQEMHISIGNYVDPTLFTNDLSFFRGDTDSGRDTGTLQVSTSFTSINNWHFVAAVVTGMGGSNPSVSLYLNGTSVGTDTGTMARTIDTSQWNTPLQFGKPGADSRYYNGYLDEIRIANTARSVQWIQTEYNNENSPSTFYSIGSEEGSTCPVTPTPTPTPTPSFPWYDCAWGYRKNITIDHAYVPASQTNFPVLVSLSSDSDLSTNALPSGNDILFTKDDGITKIPHEIESYSSGTLVAWVNVSSLSSTTDTVIIMYYGNSGASNQQNAANVWDANFVVVQHMDGSSYTALDDSTGNHNDVTSQIGTPTYLESGRIGYAVGFDGVSAVEIQDSASLDLTYKATVCAWVRSTAVSSYRRIVAKSHTINDFPYTMYGILFDGTHLRHEIASTGTQYIAVGVTDIPSSPAWTYTCGSYDRIALRVYVNGAAEGTPTGLSGDIDTNNMPLSIGRSGFDYDYYIGGIDEVRVSSANRSSTWIATEFANQNDPANFYDVGSEVESACSVTPTPTPTPAPWYDCSWQDRKRITIDHTEVSGTQTDFPVLVSIASDGDISDHAQSDGDDILFTTSDGQTQIPHEIESYTSGTGALVAWVEVPSVSSVSDTIFYMYYGNPSTSSTQTPTSVWDTSYQSVWHLKEINTGSDAIKDSTSTGNHGTDRNSPTLGAAGKIGNGVTLDGVNDYISTKIQYSNPQTFTESLWFKTTSSTSKKMFGFETSQTGTGSSDWDRILHVGTGGYVVGGFYNQSNDRIYFSRTSSTKNDGNWHQAVMTYGSGTVMLYVDGAFIAQNGTRLAQVFSGYWRMGAYKLESWPWSTGDGYFQGTLDEVRLSSSVLSAEWIATEYANQNSPSTFSSVASEESAPCTPPPTTLPTPTPTPTPNPAWFNCLWPYRKNITIDHNKVPATQTNFPVLISLSSDNDLKNHARSDGYDIVFTDTSNPPNQLSYEREFYTSATGTLVAWVKVPSVQSSAPNTTIYMYYGHSTSFDMSRPAEVWDSNYLAVWHLNETVARNTTGGTHYDSTSNGNNGVQNYNGNATGKVGGAQIFNGIKSADWINEPASTSLLSISSQLTMEAWVNLADTSKNQKIVGMSDGAATRQKGYQLAVQTGNLYPEIGNYTSSRPSCTFNAGTVSSNTWTHLAATYAQGGSNLLIGYINGAQVGAKNCANYPIVTTSLPQLRMGAESWSAAPYQWNATGIIDEVRISNTPRSANWLLTEYRNQNDPSTFYTVGSEESFICAGSGPYYVQSRSLSFGSVSQTTITLPYSTTSGNLLVLSLVYADQGLSVSSVTDSNGNTYTKAVGPTNIGGWGRLYTYYVNNAIGGATPITATVTLSGTANTVFDVFFLEYSGVAAISPLDRISAGSASSGTAMNSGGNTTTMAPSLIYGFGADDYTCHATSPYTDRETADGQCAVDRTVFMTDTYNVTATQSSSGNWALQMATFKGA